MTELVEKRNRLKSLQDAMGAVFTAAGKDIDFTKVETINGEDFKGKSTVEKAEKIRAMNDEMADLGTDVDSLVAAEKALKAARRTPDVPEVGDKITHPDQLKGRPKSFGVYTRTGVRYSAPEGAHDDCVCMLALAVQMRSQTAPMSWRPVEEAEKPEQREEAVFWEA